VDLFIFERLQRLVHCRCNNSFAGKPGPFDKPEDLFPVALVIVDHEQFE
jgi:hypothetical protein